MMRDVSVVDEEFVLDEKMVILSKTDLQGNILSYNQTFKLVSGYSDEELLGVNHRLLRHPDVPKEVFADFWATLEADRPWVGVIKNRRKDGRYYWVEASVTPRFKGGVKQEYISVRYPATREQIREAEDLFQRMSANEIVYPESHRYANLTPNLLLTAMMLLEVSSGFFIFHQLRHEGFHDNIVFLIILLAMLMLILPFLQYRLFKLSKPSELHKKSIEELCLGEYRSHIEDDDEWSFVLSQIKGSVAINSAFVYDQSVMLLEQTKQLALEKQKAESASKTKANFLANMSHEIRTPINAIIGFTNLALDETNIDSSHQYVQKVRQSSQLLLSIVNEILDFSKIEAGVLTIVHKPYCIQELINTLENMFSSMAATKGLDFSVALDTRLAPCYQGDDFRIKQVLINLISNALKFTQEGGVYVQLSLLSDNRVSFSVQDTGIGISEANIKNLFQEFQQADASITRQYGGTGLGLVICKRLVDAMDGRGITVYSEPSIGTSFSFDLPLVPCSNDQLTELKKRRNRKNQPQAKLLGRVLIVDDNEMNLEIAKAIISQMGITTTVVNSGFKAIETVQQEAFDLILMDIQMPDMDGFETTKRIHQVRPSQPVIALTAAVFGEDKEKSRIAGMVGHLNKPIEKQELYDALLPWVKVDGLCEPEQKPTPKQQAVAMVDSGLDVTQKSQEVWVDYDAGLAMFGGDVATYRMLLDMLRDQILPDLVVLFEPLKRLATEDCSEAEVDAVRKKLHALKSPVSGVCAMVLGSLLTQLHDALRNRETILLEDVVRLEQVYQSTLEDIAVWLEKTSS